MDVSFVFGKSLQSFFFFCGSQYWHLKRRMNMWCRFLLSDRHKSRRYLSLFHHSGVTLAVGQRSVSINALLVRVALTSKTTLILTLTSSDICAKKELQQNRSSHLKPLHKRKSVPSLRKNLIWFYSRASLISINSCHPFSLNILLSGVFHQIIDVVFPSCHLWRLKKRLTSLFLKSYQL